MAAAYNLVFSFGFLLFFCLSGYSIYLFGEDKNCPKVNFITLIILILAGYILMYHYFNRNQAMSQEEISMLVKGITPIPLDEKYWLGITGLLIIPICFNFSIRTSHALIINVLSVIVFVAYWLAGLQKTLSFDTFDYFVRTLLTVIPVVYFEYRIIKERFL